MAKHTQTLAALDVLDINSASLIEAVLDCVHALL